MYSHRGCKATCVLALGRLLAGIGSLSVESAAVARAVLGGGRGSTDPSPWLARNAVTANILNRFFSGERLTVRLPGEQFPADEDPVGDEAATVSGGLGNTASALAATVGGGTGNAAGNVAATVGGGAGNVASGVAAAVGGGAGNVASGEAATVPGGESNSAGGDHSFAAGRRASADHTGAFVWADARDLDFESSAPNQFRVRATGAPFATAVEFATAVDGTGAPTAGVRLLGGSATWDTLSTREAKDHFAPVDGREVLQRLVALRIESWTYQGQPPAIRHMGPMAEDFAAAFGVGADDRHISTVDLDGVALAAIQGLYQVVQGQHAQLAALEARLAALERGSAAGRD